MPSMSKSPKGGCKPEGRKFLPSFSSPLFGADTAISLNSRLVSARPTAADFELGSDSRTAKIPSRRGRRAVPSVHHFAAEAASESLLTPLRFSSSSGLRYWRVVSMSLCPINFCTVTISDPLSRRRVA